MRARAALLARRMSTPATRRVPAEGGSRPQSIRKVVVLPAPLAPKRPKISPRRTVKVLLLTASKWPKNLRKPSTSTTASVALSSVVALAGAVPIAAVVPEPKSSTKASSKAGAIGSHCSPAAGVTASGPVSTRMPSATIRASRTPGRCCKDSRRARRRMSAWRTKKHRPRRGSVKLCRFPWRSTLPSWSRTMASQRSASSK